MEYSSPFSSSSSDYYDVTDLETGISGDTANKASYSYKQSPKSNRRSRLFCEPSEINNEPHHFLDTCFHCKKLLSGNKDIFMYRQLATCLNIHIHIHIYLFCRIYIFIVTDYFQCLCLDFNCFYFFFITEVTRHFVAKIAGANRL